MISQESVKQAISLLPVGQVPVHDVVDWLLPLHDPPFSAGVDT